MRPLTKDSPLANTAGTAITSRRCTSSWNSAPSTAVERMPGLSRLSTLSACTTSGQLWQDKPI
jgi:hypothetical protein